eukprot:768367-Hanusia_phi.AAC.5
MARQEVQELLDQYYLEPGYLWSAGSFGECSSLCGSGVARRSVTCVSKLKQQVEDYLCANRSKPLAEAPCVDRSQCSYDWQVGAYSSCLVSCGQGDRRRDVSCRSSDGVVADPAMCGGLAPVAQEVCTVRASDVSVLTSACSLARTSPRAPTAGPQRPGRLAPAPAGQACSIGQSYAHGRTGWRWRTRCAWGGSRRPSRRAQERRAVTTR